MERWSDKVAIVTGASAGIGEGTVKALLKHKLKVVGLARRFERLEALAKDVESLAGKFYPLQADMTKEKDILTAFEWVRKNLGGVDILVNNAGVFRVTNLSDGDTNMWKQQLDTNVLGLCIATREAVRLMKERNVTEGQILHINSVAGHRVNQTFAPFLNVYSGTKYAVTALTETLRLELAASKLPIKVASLSPGAVKTEFGVASGANFDFDNIPHLSADDVAMGVISILSASPVCNITELTMHPLALQ